MPSAFDRRPLSFASVPALAFALPIAFVSLCGGRDAESLQVSSVGGHRVHPLCGGRLLPRGRLKLPLLDDLLPERGQELIEKSLVAAGVFGLPRVPTNA